MFEPENLNCSSTAIPCRVSCRVPFTVADTTLRWINVSSVTCDTLINHKVTPTYFELVQIKILNNIVLATNNNCLVSCTQASRRVKNNVDSSPVGVWIFSWTGTWLLHRIVTQCNFRSISFFGLLNFLEEQNVGPASHRWQNATFSTCNGAWFVIIILKECSLAWG